MARRFPIGLLMIGVSLAATGSLAAAVRVSPHAVVLDRPEASQQLLITGTADGARNVDLTRTVRYELVDPKIAEVDRTGVVRPRREGRTELLVHLPQQTLRVPVTVASLKSPPRISFQHEIIPILTKAGCNSGSCHGKAEGKNGFKLSVFGFDPRADYDAIVKQGRQRRIFPAAPERSLLLRKASSEMPHGGGRKIGRSGLPYRRLTRWIAEGVAYSSEATKARSISVEPADGILFAGEGQQLRVTAVDANGRRFCVTAEAEYISNAESIARVDARGLIRAGDAAGEATILVRYMGKVAVCRVTLPRPGVTFPRPAEANFIDRLVWNKLSRLGIAPSEVADDATFLRRVFLDTIGMLPTPDEVRTFLADTGANKRLRLIEQLLNRPEYADFWAMRWSDILRVDRDKITAPGAVAMHRWLRQQFADNRPYDEFARAILTAQGDTLAVGPASFYKVLDKPEVMSRSISQLFLGVRIECAQCHHHPSEKWGRDDFYALAGFFTGIKRKSLPGGNEAILSGAGPDLNHPQTGKPVAARALGAPPADFSNVTDRRAILADWMTADDNPYFARAIVNRLWAHYFGRGLIEPIDDLRATNPASNEPLLLALEQHLRDVKYDLKAFTTTLLSARVYQLSSKPNDANADDFQNFSHARDKALAAEVLLDAISQATGTAEKFNGWPLGYRAVQVWDNRMPSYFFRIFGRPVRASVCECERSNDPSIAQALHLMNSPEILGKIQSPTSRAVVLSASKLPPARIVEELMLATLSRLPTEDERKLFSEEFTRSKRLIAAEDILWTLLNSKEFLYNH